MKKIWELACHVVNSNIAVGSLPTLQISVGTTALFEKIYDWKADPYRHLKHRGGCTIPLFQINVGCEKCDAADTVPLLVNNY
jgi:hypothetical protein